jgi:hypothetical protein
MAHTIENPAKSLAFTVDSFSTELLLTLTEPKCRIVA